MLTWLKHLLFGRMFGAGLSSMTNGNDVSPDSDKAQLNRLEAKVSFLSALSIAQTSMLAILLIWSFVPKMSTLVILGLFAVAFLAVFHKYVPTWIRFAFKTIGSLLGNDDRPVSGKATKETLG